MWSITGYTCTLKYLQKLITAMFTKFVVIMDIREKSPLQKYSVYSTVL